MTRNHQIAFNLVRRTDGDYRGYLADLEPVEKQMLLSGWSSAARKTYWRKPMLFQIELQNCWRVLSGQRPYLIGGCWLGGYKFVLKAILREIFTDIDIL